MTAPQVCIALLTFRRNDDLARCLPAVLAQAAELSPPAQVLVVDNDPAGGAADVIDALAAPNLRYVHEPTPGIAAGRNRALDETTDLRFLIFIDDDEHPEPGWLSCLLETQRAHHAAAVVGRVVSEFDVEPEPWVKAGRFFDRRTLTTGTPVDVAATNNLLLDVAVIAELGLRFDPAFGLTGGSDTMFTRALTRSGALMCWADEAVVIDRVPASRVTREWVLKRAFRSGNSMTRVTVALSQSPRERAVVRFRGTVQGLIRIVGGGLRAALGTVARSTGHQARGLRTLYRGAGMIAGAYGTVYTEYARGPVAAVTEAPAVVTEVQPS